MQNPATANYATPSFSSARPVNQDQVHQNVFIPMQQATTITSQTMPVSTHSYGQQQQSSIYTNAKNQIPTQHKFTNKFQVNLQIVAYSQLSRLNRIIRLQIQQGLTKYTLAIQNNQKPKTLHFHNITGQNIKRKYRRLHMLDGRVKRMTV